MDTLKFEFVVKASSDPKTNVICVTTVTDTDDRTFSIPEKLQPVAGHDVIKTTPAFEKVKNTLLKRYDKRQVWISGAEVRSSYMDGDGNMEFKGFLLEEVTCQVRQGSSRAEISDETITKILESLEAKKQEYRPRSMKNMTENMVVEKFTKKTSNAGQWMDSFEAECTRVGVDEDIKKIEALRLFVEDSCLDWYSSMLIKHSIASRWTIWKDSFCETFADKGWSPVRYAIFFSYKQGSLLEYALRKERLLLEINKSMDKATLVDLIATGLPSFVVEEIDRENLKETEDLFNCIRSLEHLVNRRSLEKKTVSFENKGKVGKGKSTTYAPCRICEKENQGIRYHPEALCWFKNKTNDRPKRDPIKHVNNSELEIELNKIDPKN